MTYRSNHPQPGRVTDMLHTLRGEQFRHSQNVNRTHGSFSTPSFTSSAPIPFLKLDYSPVPESAIALQVDTPKAAGPLPKSWQLRPTENKDGRHSAAWRAKALSLIFQHRPSSQRFSLETDQVSSLTQLCLGKLLSECSTVEFIEDVIPCLPVHLRLELIRYAAIHCPLSDKMLHALLGSEGHTDGELVVVGSSASHPADHFLKAQIQGTAGDGSSQRHDSPKDWDVDDSTSVSLQSLIVVSNRLLALKLLPPTITHLVLINLENPITLHRLPRLVPLLVVLDLSYNRWLDPYSDETLRSIERIGWDHWTQLRILGWRGNVIPEGTMIRLNKGRWDDVEVVLE
jgi:hypothetical protein